jgi:plastocyanin
VGDKIKAFRDAAELLEIAYKKLDEGNKTSAEFHFSSAELLVGTEALADLAPLFREGAPPRIDTPTRKLGDQPKQPDVVGNSDEDEPDPKPQKGSLSGTIKVEGGAGAIGVVTLEPAGKKWKKRTPKERVVEQRDRKFLPRVLAIPVGSKVLFPNFDNIYHNVFSTSNARKFDLGIYKNGEAREVVFDSEGIVRLGCNLHADMSAYIVVVAAPHYAITDTSGNFKFKSLKPGKYVLKAWSERSLEPVTQEIVIKAGENTVAVGVKADAPEGLQPDKFGVARGKK